MSLQSQEILCPQCGRAYHTPVHSQTIQGLSIRVVVIIIVYVNVNSKTITVQNGICHLKKTRYNIAHIVIKALNTKKKTFETLHIKDFRTEVFLPQLRQK